jgi:signal transduction histidine kinase
MRELINSTIESLSGVINNKSIDITVDGNDDVFYGDFNWIREALMNIIKNCIEHSSKIDISYASNPIYTEIRIKDNGEGISKEDIKHIFERFYKSKGSSKDSIGIGLSLSKSIIESLNGEISVKSIKNKYTEFIIKIYK